MLFAAVKEFCQSIKTDKVIATVGAAPLLTHGVVTCLPGGTEAGSSKRGIRAELDPERVPVRSKHGRGAVAAVTVDEVGVFIGPVS